MPHTKTYTRISKDGSKLWWYALGSGNLSKAAWGKSGSSTYRILNYEAWVVFIPKFFVRNHNHFRYILHACFFFIFFSRIFELTFFFLFFPEHRRISVDEKKRRINANVHDTIRPSIEAVSSVGQTFRHGIKILNSLSCHRSNISRL